MHKTSSLPISVPLLLWLLIWALVPTLVTQRAAADSKDFPRAVIVPGSCIKTLTPDRGSVVVTADVLKADLPAASAESLQIYTKVKNAVQALNLKDVEFTTTESSFQEEKEWRKEKSISKGFRARMGLQVSTTEVARLGEVLGLAGKQGIRQVSGLNTFVSPERAKFERESCLEEAVKNARAKAESIGRAASTKVGRVLEVVEQTEGQGPVSPMRNARTFSAQMEMAAAPAAASVDTGTEKLTVNISATFAFD